ncbi:uncharacterized protein LOC143033242 [Oratosquilla oratoria]|uniref:uncharacterized protein LOC143033242 n=1 Tax=Oratosquilla oratoria TaxID=337810 RepID=UPI003F75A8A0
MPYPMILRRHLVPRSSRCFFESAFSVLCRITSELLQMKPRKIDGLDRRCTSGCSCQVSEELVSMDRPSEMRSSEGGEQEGPLPAKDALPCYMCAINNLENCTHLDAVSKDVNSNAVSMNNTPAPIHHGGRDIPPSYAASCPELVPPGHVTVTMGDPQVATQNSEVLDSSDERERRRRGKNVMVSVLTLLLGFIFMWIFWKSR